MDFFPPPYVRADRTWVAALLLCGSLCDSTAVLQLSRGALAGTGRQRRPPDALAPATGAVRIAVRSTRAGDVPHALRGFARNVGKIRKALSRFDICGCDTTAAFDHIGFQETRVSAVFSEMDAWMST